MREKHIPPRPGNFESVTPEPTETMRDRIAIKVLDRLLTEPVFYNSPTGGMTPAEYIAQQAYSLADAMMKERLK